MDILAVHKVTGVRTAIESAGASLLCLLPYSLDFNPIDMAFPSRKRCHVIPAAETTASRLPPLPESPDLRFASSNRLF
jgi:transposase